MKNKKGFTLIELLAIIVILAIIAVITVPIILNIIDNSKKGAATDSAYGFKDAVNKWYVEKLTTDHDFMLKSAYTVQDGKIKDASNSSDQGTLIPVSGEKPSSGELHYSNNVLKGGCLVVGDYEVTFKSDGSVDKTEKGDCSDYIFSSDESEIINDPDLVNFTIDETCPGCTKFGKNWDDDVQLINQPLTVETLSSYNSYGNLFYGYVVDNNIVKRAFACLIKNNNVICLEGYNASKYSKNIQIAQHFFDDCDYEAGDSAYTCGQGQSISLQVQNNGFVNVGEMGNADCSIYPNDNIFCH